MAVLKFLRREAIQQNFLQTQTRTDYSASIDGLRGIAVVSVILYHVDAELLPGGYLGVDAFFVISGFLITGLLRKQIALGQFSWVNFMLKRANRLLPALSIVTLATVATAWIFFSAPQLDRFGNSVISVGSYVSNFVFMLDDSYFEQSPATTPLLHTWSLAVEEQFYVLFPLFMLLCSRLSNKRTFLVLLSLTTLSLFSWIVLRGFEIFPSLVDPAFYMLPTRAWELGAGALVAVGQSQIRAKIGRGRNLVAFLALTVLFGALAFGGVQMNRGLASIAVVASIALIIATHSRSRVERLLSSRILVYIGILSYGLYLWHFPIIATIKISSGAEALSPGSIFLVFAASGTLALLSAILIENPVRYQDWNKGRSIIRVVGFMTLFALVGYFSKLPAVDISAERQAAQQLIHNDWAYFNNLDEKVFLLERLETAHPSETNLVVVGSSRTMQVGSDASGESTLNLSVSGASLSTLEALGPTGLVKTGADKIIIGLDPWMLNSNFDEGNNRALESLMDYWRTAVTSKGTLEAPHKPINSQEESKLSVASRIFLSVNESIGAVPKDGNPELIAKKGKDGSHIYELSYANRTEAEYSIEFPELLEFGNMHNFERSPRLQSRLIALLSFLKDQEIRVILVLPPYHPALYQQIESKSPGILQAEEAFIQIAAELDLPVFGGYDPAQSGCSSSHFYDGMHPKSSCMKKALQSPVAM